MKLTTVRYEKTFNLGNYETERIAAEASVEEGECPDYVLQELKMFVTGEEIGNTYKLKDGTGAIRFEYDTARDWMDMYDQCASRAQDLKSYKDQNKMVFGYIKAEAEQQDNKMFASYIKQIEERLK